jgi:hypothetical protein
MIGFASSAEPRGRFVASSLGCLEASGNRTKVHFPFHVSFEQYSDAYFSVLE